MPGSSASEWKFAFLCLEFLSDKPAGISAVVLYFYFLIIQANVSKKMSPTTATFFVIRYLKFSYIYIYISSHFIHKALIINQRLCVK
jgi:hypothetical protein